MTLDDFHQAAISEARSLELLALGDWTEYWSNRNVCGSYPIVEGLYRAGDRPPWNSHNGSQTLLIALAAANAHSQAFRSFFDITDIQSNEF